MQFLQRLFGLSHKPAPPPSFNIKARPVHGFAYGSDPYSQKTSTVVETKDKQPTKREVEELTELVLHALDRIAPGCGNIHHIIAADLLTSQGANDRKLLPTPIDKGYFQAVHVFSKECLQMLREKIPRAQKEWAHVLEQEGFRDVAIMWKWNGDVEPRTYYHTPQEQRIIERAFAGRYRSFFTPEPGSSSGINTHCIVISEADMEAFIDAIDSWDVMFEDIVEPMTMSEGDRKEMEAYKFKRNGGNRVVKEEDEELRIAKQWERLEQRLKHYLVPAKGELKPWHPFPRAKVDNYSAISSLDHSPSGSASCAVKDGDSRATLPVPVKGVRMHK